MKTARYLLAILTIFIATACSDDKGYDYGDFHYDLVTYIGSEAGMPSFEFQAYEDSPLITLRASNVKTLDLKIGQRLLLNYIIDSKQNESTKVVTLKGLSQVVTDTLRVASESQLPSLKREPIKLASIWRTGNYINIRCQLQYTEKARQLMLVADASTVKSSRIETYLVQDLLDATAYYWTPCYISYYIKPAWDMASCHTLRVNVNDLTYPDVKYYDFTKSN